MRTLDKWESACFSSPFLASGFSRSQTLSTPAHLGVTETVGQVVVFNDRLVNMGSVKMGRRGSYWFKGGGGIYIGRIVNCVYCDKCGSFQIRQRLDLRTLIWILPATLIAIIFWAIAETNAFLLAISCFIIQLAFLFELEAFDKIKYKCGKCGNDFITFDNVKNYPENDQSVLDIPSEETVTYITEDY
jgi:hypothetical protein